MKKTALVIISVTIFALTLALGGCYISNPADMDELIGTYQLTAYTRRPKNAEAEDENATINMIDEYGITAYLIIKSDGFGYYVYKDNDEEVEAYSIKINYSYDEENSDEIKEIHYDDGAYSSGEAFPGKGKETLGLNFKKKSKRLTYFVPSSDLFKRDYSQSVEYTKVDDATDLSYASKQVGKTLTAVEFGLKDLDCLLINQDSDSENVYTALSFSPDFKTATYYYAKKSDKMAMVETNIPVSVSYDDTAVITAGKTYYRYINGTMYPSVYTTVGNNAYFTLSKYYAVDQTKSYTEILQDILDEYIKNENAE